MVELRGDYASQWAAISSIASKIGGTAETLRQVATDRGEREGVAPSARERLKALEREKRELKRANAIFRLASACFAQAERDRLRT